MQQFGNEGSLGGVTPSPSGQAREVARTSTQQVKELTQTTKDRALREMDGKRHTLAGEVEKLASALENQRGESEIAGPALQYAATGARRFATALRDHTAEELFESAKRNPTVLLAGTFAIGFFATRLFKA
jgi:hypothetical protein